MGRKWHAVAALAVAFAAAAVLAVAADRGLSLVGAAVEPEAEEEVGLLRKVVNMLWSGSSEYHHVWPVTRNYKLLHIFEHSFSFDGEGICLLYQSSLASLVV
jgi:hypothetical protein